MGRLLVNIEIFSGFDNLIVMLVMSETSTVLLHCVKFVHGKMLRHESRVTEDMSRIGKQTSLVVRMMMPNLSSDVNTVHWVPRYAVNFSIYILSYLYFLYIYNLMMYLHISMYMHMPQNIYIYIHTHIIQCKVTRWVASTYFLGILTLKIGKHEQFDLHFSTRLEKTQSRPFDLNVKGVEGYNIEVPWGSCLLNWIWLRRMCCFNTLWTVSLFDEVSASIRWWNILK